MNVQDTQQALGSTSGQQELFERPFAFMPEPSLQSLQQQYLQHEGEISTHPEPEQYLLVPVPDETWARYDG